MTNDDYKKFTLTRFIIKHKKTNLPLAFLSGIIIFILVFFIIPKEYTSEVSILPPAATFSQGFASQLGSISKLAGLDLGSDMGRSQELYMGIIRSRLLQKQILENVYEFESVDEKTVLKSTLLDFFEIEVESEREKYEQAYKKMRDDIVTVNIDAENEILYLAVTTENPFLSTKVANKIMEVLNDIVNTQVQKEFRQKLSYLSTRLGEIQDSLKVAEIEFKTFLEYNPDPSTPDFQIKNIRYRRNLQIQTELLIEYRKQHEMFIADNMINLADIKVLDEAVPPYLKSRPKRILLSGSLFLLLLFLQIGINAAILIFRNFKNEVLGSPFEKSIP